MEGAIFCGLFYDSLSISDYTTSNHRMIGQNCIGKDMEGEAGQEIRINGRGIRCADHATPSIRKSWH
jgi:hypothetical protein